MHSRLVSLVLIAAVIACPMWCGNGLCCASECYLSQDVDAAGQASMEGKPNCCCDDEIPSRRPDNRQSPPESTEFSCQGICGGAIFERSVDVDHGSHLHCLPLIDDDAPVTAQLADCGSPRSEQHRCRSDSNHGRFVRTLHMSYLC